MSKSKVLIGIDKSGSYRVHLTITTGIVEEARKTLSDWRELSYSDPFFS